MANIQFYSALMVVICIAVYIVYSVIGPIYDAKAFKKMSKNAKFLQDQEYSREQMDLILNDFTMNTPYGFGIIYFTTISFDGSVIPVVYGDVRNPVPMLGFDITKKSQSSKRYFTFSQISTTLKLYTNYPDMFKFCGESGSNQIYFIKNIQKLEKLITEKDQ